MNRSEFQNLADIRKREAEILLENGCFEGAYYLAGYAVECALKACISKQFMQYDFPDKNLVNKSYTHDLSILLGLAGLTRTYEQQADQDANFASNWAVTKDWSEQDRYTNGTSKQKALDLINAIVDPNSGVLEWLKTLW